MAQNQKAAGFPAAGFPPERVCEGGGGGREGGRDCELSQAAAPLPSGGGGGGRCD